MSAVWDGRGFPHQIARLSSVGTEWSRGAPVTVRAGGREPRMTGQVLPAVKVFELNLLSLAAARGQANSYSDSLGTQPGDA